MDNTKNISTGLFYKIREGVLSMVRKKYGKHAAHIARQMVERMAPEQTITNTVDPELERLKQLSGIALD